MSAEMLTYREAAEHLQVSTKWLRRRVALGLIVCVKLGGRVRFTPDDLRAFARRCRVMRAVHDGNPLRQGRRPVYVAPDDEATLDEKVRLEMGRQLGRSIAATAGKAGQSGK